MGADGNVHGAECVPECMTRAGWLTRDADRLTSYVEANHRGRRAESAIRCNPINRRACDANGTRSLARLILMFQSVTPILLARGPMTSTVRP